MNTDRTAVWIGLGGLGLIAALLLYGAASGRVKKKRLSGYRRIGGKLYHRAGKFRTKTEAQHYAKAFRADGKRARIVAVGDELHVYTKEGRR